MRTQHTLTVVVRKHDEHGLELFYVNANDVEKSWWIEGYSPRDGHFQPSRAYVRSLMLQSNHDEAKALIARWDALPGAEGFKIYQGSKLTGPRGYTYIGD